MSAGRLLSVNVGLPKNVEWQGRTVFTGVYKQTLDGRCAVGRLNLEGDGQGDLGGHGGEQRAVFVYQIESYHHWEDELHRSDFVYGQFGENFTVEGLGDDQVCIGDRYRIGSALFEVTQPRVTCYRVGLRMNDPRMPALLVTHHRPGFYFRVLEEGEVGADDQIVKVESGPEQMPVAEADGLLYLPGHTRQQLNRVLRIPALSPGWQESFRALLASEPGSGNAGLTVAGPPPAWTGFRRLTVAAIAGESDSVSSIELAAPSEAPLPTARPGQYLTVRVSLETESRSLLRNYSLSSAPGAGSYQISVKHESHGVVSSYLCSQLRAGDQLDIGAPRGSFILDDAASPVLLISAGVGATPVLAMLKALVDERSEREIWWLYGARNGGEHPFAAETRALIGRLAHARMRVWYSHPGPADALGRDYEEAGRLTSVALATLGLPADAHAYICGPPPFMDDVTAGLGALGVDAADLHTEVFGPDPSVTPGIAAAPARRPHPPRGQPGTGPRIAFARSDLTVRWDESYTSLLELAEACDVPVRWSCRTGVCHTCESPLIDGAVDYDPDPVEPPASGSVLICCSQPHDDLVLDL